MIVQTYYFIASVCVAADMNACIPGSQLYDDLAGSTGIRLKWDLNAEQILDLANVTIAKFACFIFVNEI